MRVVVDRGLCKGHGVCMEEAPEVFRVARDGTMTLLLEEPPEEQRARIQEAVKYCPTGALSLLDDGAPDRRSASAAPSPGVDE
jgi:ferredoxin